MFEKNPLDPRCFYLFLVGFQWVRSAIIKSAPRDMILWNTKCFSARWLTVMGWYQDQDTRLDQMQVLRKLFSGFLVGF